MSNAIFIGKHFEYNQLSYFFSFFCTVFSILFVLIGLSNCGVCPSRLSISPCTCENDKIICSGISSDNELAKVFKELSYSYEPGQQQFESFKLKDSSIEQIPNDVFQGVWFKNIEFDNNPKSDLCTSKCIWW